MKRFRSSVPFSACALVLSVSACAPFWNTQPEDALQPQPEPPAAATSDVPADPALTSAPPPPPEARTAATLDTTSAEQRAQAAAPAAPETPARDLGTTVASLGSPTEPGFWLKTPLVKTETMGRVTNPANGKSSAVTLIPIDGPADGGSRLSLPAMRLIGASLTDLTPVTVTLEG